MARRQYGTQENAADKKRRLGVRMNIFLETFAVTKISDERWKNYRFKKLMGVEFDKAVHSENEQRNLERLDRLLQYGEISEKSMGRFVLLIYYLDNVKHAYALCVDKRGVVAVYDSSEAHVLYTNKPGDRQYKVSEIYEKGHIINLYELRCTESKEPENLTFIKQMMTGEEWSIVNFNEERKQEKLKQAENEPINPAPNQDTSESAESQGEPPAHRKTPRYSKRKGALSQRKQHRSPRLRVPKEHLEPEDMEPEDYA